MNPTRPFDDDEEEDEQSDDDLSDTEEQPPPEPETRKEGKDKSFVLDPRMFDSVDSEGMARLDQSVLDYTLCASPKGQVEGSEPASSGKPYKEEEVHMERALTFFHTSSITSTKDFIQKGPTPRSTRKRGRQGPYGMGRTNRISTLEQRIQEFRPFFEHQLATYRDGGWAGAKYIWSIRNLTTVGSLYGEDEREAMFGCDKLQGVGLRELDSVVAIIGCIEKVGPPPSSFVNKLCKDIGVLPVQLQGTAHKPCLFLDDTTAKIRLDLRNQVGENALKYEDVVSGVPIAVKGLCFSGRLWVQDFMYATPLPSFIPWTSIKSDIDVIFVSGLNMGTCDQLLVDLLIDYLTGLGGTKSEQSSELLRKTSIFFVGNIFPKRKQWDPDKKEEMIYTSCNTAKKLDMLFTQLAETMEVFIVPGGNDPTHKSSIPQPALHNQFFPRSTQFPTFHLLTNPAKIALSLSPDCSASESTINIVLSTSGNVRETMEHCHVGCPLEMCVKLMEWSHLYPASCDDGDISESLLTLTASLPHLFVLGGLVEMQTTEWNGVKILGVPSFSNTGQISILHKNGAISPLSFSTTLKYR